MILATSHYQMMKIIVDWGTPVQDDIEETSVIRHIITRTLKVACAMSSVGSLEENVSGNNKQGVHLMLRKLKWSL